MAGAECRRRPSVRSLGRTRPLSLRDTEASLILPPRLFVDTAFWIALFGNQDQYRRNALAWQSYLARSGTKVVTTEAVCWEWLNAMSRVHTRRIATIAFRQFHDDPGVQVIPHTPELDAAAFRLFAARPDKDWSLTDCLSFVVMERNGLHEALTADNHFEQAGFRALLYAAPPTV